MARSFGTIATNLWDHPQSRRLSHDALLLYCYLRTCRHATGASAYVIRLAYIIEDVRMDAERVSRAFRDLEMSTFMFYDGKASVVYFPGYWLEKGNKIANPNVAKFIAGELLALPDSPLKAKAIDDLKVDCSFTAAVAGIIGDWRAEPAQPALPWGGDTGQPALIPPAGAPPKPGKKVKLGTRLPAQWSLPSDWRVYAASRGHSDTRIDAEATKFHRHFTGPDCKKPAKKDWFRTWQNWVDSLRGANGNGAHPPGTNGTAVYTTGLDDGRWPLRVNEFRKSGQWLSSWGPEPGKPGCKVPPELLAPVA